MELEFKMKLKFIHNEESQFANEQEAIRGCLGK